MGVSISTHSSTSPLSFASTIIGFVSFTFTVATALRVFWDNFQTMIAAPREIDDYLTNLKQSLHEELYHLRRARKIRSRSRRRSRSAHGARGGAIAKNGATVREGRSDESPDIDMALKSMTQAIKHMIRNFKEMERPFLRDSDQPKSRRRSSFSEKWGEEGYYPGYSSGDAVDNTSESDIYHPEYRQCGLRERWKWLSVKADAVNMSAAVARMTTRRMSIQITRLAMYEILKILELSRELTIDRNFRELGQDVDEFDDRLYGVEQRLSRVVGIRRIQ
jgi:hypothetical protein